MDKKFYFLGFLFSLTLFAPNDAVVSVCLTSKQDPHCLSKKNFIETLNKFGCFLEQGQNENASAYSFLKKYDISFGCTPYSLGVAIRAYAESLPDHWYNSTLTDGEVKLILVVTQSILSENFSIERKKDRYFLEGWANIFRDSIVSLTKPKQKVAKKRKK